MAAAKPRPIVSLPRGVEEELAQVRIFVELSRAPAGCFICNRPIPKGVSRFSVVVRLPEPIVNKSGQVRRNERYNAHSGCLAKKVTGSEVLRSGASCYDCGFEKEPEPVEGDEGGTVTFTQGIDRWSAWCFTTSKFAPAPLCDTCKDKPKWAECPVCTIHYPPWMIHTVAGAEEELDPPSMLAEGRRYKQAEPGSQACSPCCARWGG